MPVQIVALTGPMGSGKSTICRYIKAAAAKSNIECEVLSFATPIKMGCHVMFGGEAAHWYGNKKNEVIPYLNKTPRELMQKLGTEFGRDMIDPLVWIKIMHNNLLAIIENVDKEAINYLILVDDLRFVEEADMFTELKAPMFRIDVDGEVPANVVHRSEAGIPIEKVTRSYIAARGDQDSLQNIAKLILKSVEFSG